MVFKPLNVRVTEDKTKTTQRPRVLSSADRIFPIALPRRSFVTAVARWILAGGGAIAVAAVQRELLKPQDLQHELLYWCSAVSISVLFGAALVVVPKRRAPRVTVHATALTVATAVIFGYVLYSLSPIPSHTLAASHLPFRSLLELSDGTAIFLGLCCGFIVGGILTDR